MTTLKTNLGEPSAHETPFQPTTDVPRSNVQAAIEYVATLAGGTPTTGAPDDAQYLTSASNATLTNERVVQDGTGIAWDFTGIGSAVANLSFLGLEALTDPGGDRLLHWDDDAGTLTWATCSGPVGFDGTNLTIVDVDLAAIVNASFAQGDVLYHNGTTLARLPAGDLGDKLTSGGAGANPYWSDAGSGNVTATNDATADNRLVRTDGTGKAIQDSGITVDDSANITGVTSLSVTDDAYAVGWNGSTNVPTKNAVYDKIETILTTTLPGAYQPLDADLTSWAGVTRASGVDTFVTTPSSANLASLVTDETGSGALVFATSPTLVTPVLGAASGTSLTLSSGTGLTVGSSVPFSDSAGTLTLQNVDALDATTEDTIESAIDTLANLGSIQGQAFTFGSYAPTILNNTTELGFKQAVNLEIGVDVQAYDADLATWSGVTPAADVTTFLATPTSANLAAAVTDETGSGALVFGTSPTLTTSALLTSGFVFNWNGNDVTLTHSADTLTMAGGQLVLPAAGLTVGSSIPFSDSAGTLTLQNVDALDATTEATVEAAIDTLTNLTSIQGQSFTFGSYAPTVLNNTSELGFKQAVNLEIGVDVQAYDADLSTWAGVTPAAGVTAFLATPTSANLITAVTDETGSGALVFANTPTLVTPAIGAATGTSLSLSSGTGLQVGSSIPFSDSAGTLTLQNIDALDATTEATIEAAIDTLANLGSIQGQAFTFGAYAPTLLNNANEAAFKAATNLEIGVDVQAYDADLTTWAGVTPAAGVTTFLATPSSANLASAVTDETGSGALMFGTSPVITTDITIPNTGLHVLDTDASHDLIIKPGSNLTADHTLTVTTGDADRTLDISAASVTVSSFGATLVDDADASTARSTLGLVIGTDVQAYDADLTTWAGITPAANVGTFLATPSSANLIAAVTDETGSGALVFANTPTLVTPVLGAATGTSLNLSSGTGLQVGASVPFSDSAGTLTLQNIDALDATTEATVEAAIDTLANLTSIQGRTVTLADAGANAIFGWDDAAGAYENLTAAEATAVLNAYVGDSGSGGTKGVVPAPIAGDSTKFLKGDGTWAAIPGGGDALTSSPLSQFAATTSLQLKDTISDETGSGALVFADTPTLIAPVLGTPTSGTLTNCTLPVGGITGLGTGVATFLATPSSANLATAVTDETGSGAVMFGTSPSVTTDIRPASHDGASLGTAALGFSDAYFGTGGTITFGAASTPDVVLTHSTDALTVDGGALVVNSPSANYMRVVGGDLFTNVPLILSNRRSSNTTFTSRLNFSGNDSAGNETTFASIGGTATATTDTAEEGRIDFLTVNAGTLATRMLMTSTSLHPNANDGMALGTTSLQWSDVHLASGAVVNFAASDVTITHSSNALDIDGGVVDFGSQPTLNGVGLAVGWREPGGRLSLTSGDPAAVTTVTAGTTVYYTPYTHSFVPIYDGTSWEMKQFTELSQATTDATKSPAACTTGSCYDIFVWNDSGTMRATRGPVWSTNTYGASARGTGAATTELEQVNSIYVNKYSISNGPAAQRGTYVGTIQTDGSSQVNHTILNNGTAGAQTAKVGYNNFYNARHMAIHVGFTPSSYTYNSTTVRGLNGGGSATGVEFPMCFQNRQVFAILTCTIQSGTTSASDRGQIGIGVNSSTAIDTYSTALNSVAGVAGSGCVMAQSTSTPPAGRNYICALEKKVGNNGTGTAPTFWPSDGTFVIHLWY